MVSDPTRGASPLGQIEAMVTSTSARFDWDEVGIALAERAPVRPPVRAAYRYRLERVNFQQP